MYTIIIIIIIFMIIININMFVECGIVLIYTCFYALNVIIIILWFVYSSFVNGPV